MYWYWPNINLECKQYIDQWIKWKMHTFQKRKRVIKYIRSKKPYERYQVDLVELAKELNMKDKFKYLLKWVYHFSKYAWAIPIRNKEAVPVRNALAQVFKADIQNISNQIIGKNLPTRLLKVTLRI